MPSGSYTVPDIGDDEDRHTLHKAQREVKYTNAHGKCIGRCGNIRLLAKGYL